MLQLSPAAIIDGWGKVGALACTILASAYYLGRAVGRIESEAKLTRIDLTMLFKHFGLTQPSQVLMETRANGKAKGSILGIVGK